MFKKRDLFIIGSVLLLMVSNLYIVSLGQAVLAQPPPNDLGTDENIEQPKIMPDTGRFRGLGEADRTASPNTINLTQGMFNNTSEPPEPQSGFTDLQGATLMNFTLEYSDTPPTLTDEQLESLREELEEVNPSDSVPLVNTNISGPEPGTQTNTTDLEPGIFNNTSQSSVSPSLSTVSLDGYERVSEIERRHIYGFDGLRGGARGTPVGLGSVLEPSVANKGPIILYVFNTFVARSPDNGRTWQFNTDPTLGMGSYFPSGVSRACCDQDVIYDPNNHIFIWYTQANKEASGRNFFRLLISEDGQSWLGWAFTPETRVIGGVPTWTSAGLGLPVDETGCDDPNARTCMWFDYPQLATSTNSLYITTNMFWGTKGESAISGSSAGHLILRMSLKELAAGALSGWSWVRDWLHTITPVQGATDTMYLATHISNFGMRIYRFVEGPQGVFFKYFNVNVDPWWSSDRGSMSCPSRDGNNFCGRSDDRILTGWTYSSGFDDILGFMWNVGQNSVTPEFWEPCEPVGVFEIESPPGTCFPYPYINAAVFRDDADPVIDDLDYIARPYVWSDEKAWQYSFTSPIDKIPWVGIAAFSGGGPDDFPAINFGVADGLDLEHGPNWKMFGRLEGTAAPSSNTWGDYLRVRPYTMTEEGETLKCPVWIGSGYIQRGATGTGNEIIPLWFTYGVEIPGMSDACPR